LADRDRLFEFLTETNLAAAERAMSVLSQALEDIAAFPRSVAPGRMATGS